MSTLSSANTVVRRSICLSPLNHRLVGLTGRDLEKTNSLRTARVILPTAAPTPQARAKMEIFGSSTARTRGPRTRTGGNFFSSSLTYAPLSFRVIEESAFCYHRLSLTRDTKALSVFRPLEKLWASTNPVEIPNEGVLLCELPIPHIDLFSHCRTGIAA